jgi:8-oxo-dGTP pyrophosphatase MutT (NUDIX family)
MDVWESYEAAAARELTEELGVRVPVRFLFKFLCLEGTSSRCQWVLRWCPRERTGRACR